MTILKLSNIKMKYNTSDFELDISELEINRSEFFGLIGESGCGKTTLLKTIGGLQSLDHGQLLFDNKDITRLKAEERNMSMVFQESLLFPHMSVIDNVAFPLKIRGVEKKERYQKASSYLSKVGLEGFDKRYPSQLSGGQQQRVSIARALIHEPEIILMDEPFSALDPELRDEMRHLVKSLQQSLDLTIIFVTHQLDEAALLFDRVAMISDGKIIQQGKPSDIYKAPKTIEVAKFFGFKNIFEGNTRPAGFEISKSNIIFPDPVDDAHCVLIPNHAISRSEAVINHIAIEGTVIEKNFVHGLIHFRINVGGNTLHYFESMSSEKPIIVGDRIEMFIHLEKLIYFAD